MRMQEDTPISEEEFFFLLLKGQDLNYLNLILIIFIIFSY
jgi:hypothetical protein